MFERFSYSLSRKTKSRGFNQRRPVFADFRILCTSKRRCNVGYLNPSVLEVHMFFHSIETIKNDNWRNGLMYFYSCLAETLIGYTVQQIPKTWTIYAMIAILARLENSDLFYIVINLEKNRVVVLSKKEEGFVSREQSHNLLHRKAAVTIEADVKKYVWAIYNMLNAALRFVFYLWLDRIALTFSNTILYAMPEGWNRFSHCKKQSRNLPGLFQLFLSFVASAYGVARRTPHATVFIEVETVLPYKPVTDVTVAEESPTAMHALYIPDVVSLYQLGNASTIAWSPKEHCLHTATKAATKVVKEEDLLIVIVTANLLLLSPELRATHDVS